MKKKIFSSKLKALLVISIVLISLISGALIGYFIPKNIYYEQQTNASGIFVIDGWLAEDYENYTSETTIILILVNMRVNYDKNTNILSLNLTTIIEYFSVTHIELVTEHPHFMKYVDENNLYTSVTMPRINENYFSIKITFWVMIIK